LFDSIYEKDYSNFTEGIAITFDKELTFEYQISLNMIAEKIESVYSDLVCVFSPNHLCKMDIYVDMNEIEIAKLEIKLKQCPLAIRRMYNEHVGEEWAVNEMEMPFL
jgi:hypothetical protein